MKKLLYVGMCLCALFFLFACDKDDVNGYTPLPKLHLGETFRYRCEPENYIRLEYDTLGEAAVLNFYKDEVTSLDYLDYDENSCTFSFHKGETGLYRISWDYTSENPCIAPSTVFALKNTRRKNKQSDRWPVCLHLPEGSAGSSASIRFSTSSGSLEKKSMPVTFSTESTGTWYFCRA